ncbi:MAG: hypothetical protein K0Q79_3503 [Flavipsychrobacter sp.]|jgi:hypothetical protein|nr:hypothetical protein [Flavipsychrobacter sp.]
MNTVLEGKHIQVVSADTIRIIYMNGGKSPYFMGWNERRYKWEFTGSLIPEELVAIENAISNFIIQQEKAAR